MTVYLLTDNLPDSIFAYVGRTDKPLGARQYEHWLNYQGNPAKKNWLKYVRSHGFEVEIKALGNFKELSYIWSYANNPGYISLNSRTDLSASKNNVVFYQVEHKSTEWRRRVIDMYPVVHGQNLQYAARLSSHSGSLFIPEDGVSWLKDLEAREVALRPLLTLPKSEYGVLDWLAEQSLIWDVDWHVFLRDVFLQVSAVESVFYADLWSRLLVEHWEESAWNWESASEVLVGKNIPVDGHSVMMSAKGLRQFGSQPAWFSDWIRFLQDIKLQR